eukprot:153929_1
MHQCKSKYTIMIIGALFMIIGALFMEKIVIEISFSMNHTDTINTTEGCQDISCNKFHYEDNELSRNISAYDLMNLNLTVASVRLNLCNKRINFPMYVAGSGFDIVSKDILTDGRYEPGTIRTLDKYNGISCGCLNRTNESKQKKSCFFIDIGANLGVISLSMAHIGYDVLSFEAFPTNYQIFYKTLQLPQNKDLNIRIMPHALGNTTVLCNVWAYIRNTQDGTLSCGKDMDKMPKLLLDLYQQHEIIKINQAPIETKRFDDLYNKVITYDGSKLFIDNNTVIDALKIDVEGFEPFVLDAAHFIFERGLVHQMISECRPLTYGFFAKFAEKYDHLYDVSRLRSCRQRMVNIIITKKH